MICNPTTLLAIALGKTVGSISRRLRIGGGTNFPGAIARRIAPHILRRLTATLPHGVILLSGTNGKTTTTRMLAEILRADGHTILHNRAGANLISGLTATALADTDLLGRLHGDIGLFETDEAALSQAIVETNPRIVLIHNLFRDQLDRYGEVDTIANTWRGALQNLPSTATVILNSDDPAVAYLGEGLRAHVYYYGLNDQRHATGAAAHIADSQFCRRCGARYTYTMAFYAHIGHYICPKCGHHRPEPHIRLARLDLQGTNDARLYITHPHGALEFNLPLPGLYNAVNALAAAAIGLTLRIAPARIRTTLEGFSAAFGRIERVRAGKNGAPLLIALIKNPVGAGETVRMLLNSVPQSSSTHAAGVAHDSLAAPAPWLHIFIAINDRAADGIDVSWLWDTDFEDLAAHVAMATVSGTRAEDMAVRLKYAGIAPERIDVIPALPLAIDTALARVPPQTTLYILPTYTAMLELRADFAQRGWVRQFWEE